MKKFLQTILLFSSIIVIILIIAILSPTTYSASQSLLFSSLKKDSLLYNTPQPRIILVGGSSLSYGLVSSLIKDSLDINPINAGIHAGLGLKYILDSTEPYLKEGDIYVIAPEYEQYYENALNGTDELLRMVLDVSLSNAKRLDWKQIKQISPFIPQYIKSKLQIKSYYSTSVPPPYRYTAFNEYGDAYLHWNMAKVNYPESTFGSTSEFNNETLEYLLSVIKKLEERGVSVYVSFPGIQDIAANNNRERMNKVYDELKGHNIKLLGKPSDYIIPNSLTYDTYYHLLYKGAEQRTNTLISFLKEDLNK